jgi:hypothetical protein
MVKLDDASLILACEISVALFLVDRPMGFPAVLTLFIGLWNSGQYEEKELKCT